MSYHDPAAHELIAALTDAQDALERRIAFLEQMLGILVSREELRAGRGEPYAWGVLQRATLDASVD